MSAIIPLPRNGEAAEVTTPQPPRSATTKNNPASPTTTKELDMSILTEPTTYEQADSLVDAAQLTVQSAATEEERLMALERLGEVYKGFGLSAVWAYDWASHLLSLGGRALTAAEESALLGGYANAELWDGVPAPDHNDMPDWVTVTKSGRDYTGATDVRDFILSEDVWSFSPVMDHIRRAAVSRRLNPGGLLVSVLGHLASLQQYRTRVITSKRESPVVLNTYVALIAGSGSNKTKTLNTADDLMEEYTRANMPWTGRPKISLGTGEGLTETFMGSMEADVPKRHEDGTVMTNDDGTPITSTQKIRGQVRNNALFVNDEGRKVMVQGMREGSTLFSAMCSWWIGASIGEANAKAENSRSIERGSYAGAMLFGFQTGMVDALFADQEGGLPQRFLYAPTAYFPGKYLDWDDLPDYPGPLEIPAMQIPGTDMRELPGQPQIREWTITLPEWVERQVDEEQKGRGAGDTAGNLDAHDTLLRCKLVALLAILHGTTQVTDDLWHLSGEVMKASTGLRNFLDERIKTKAREIEQRKDERIIQRDLTTHVNKKQIDREGDRLNGLVKKLTKKLSGGSLSSRDARRSMNLSAEDFSAVVAEAEFRGEVEKYSEKPASGPAKEYLRACTDSE